MTFDTAAGAIGRTIMIVDPAVQQTVNIRRDNIAGALTTVEESRMLGALLYLVVIMVWVRKENRAVNWRLKQTPDSQWDASSLRLLKWGSSAALVLALLLSFIVEASLFSQSIVAFVAAALVLAAGSWVRVRAIRDLSERFTPNVVILENHTLHSDGVYRFMRHPGYCGALLIYAGMALLLNNAASLIVLMSILVPLYLYRIHVEEKALSARFGDAYAAYSRRTRRLIPWVY